MIVRTMKYYFTLDRDFNIYISELKDILFVCEWGSINHGILTIRKGYSWDGCTCAIDTKRNYTACLIHDFLCQFNPIPKEESDVIFLYLLEYDNFQLSRLYYEIVKTYHYTKKTIKKWLSLFL